MAAQPRSLQAALEELSHEKFVLLGGPRQVGKTTLATEWLALRGGELLSWDAPPDRARILRNEPFAMTGGLVLDELHKHQRWKSYLKGLYDKARDRLSVVVTGSARMETFTRGGDSMLGRYELLRLHPLSLGELSHGRLPPPPASWLDIEGETGAGTLEQLETFGGFPEPFLRATKTHYARWSARRRDLLLGHDLRELSQIRALSLVEHLWYLLPDRVGAPLSVNALREEVGVAHDTLSAWLEVLERLYLVYRLPPFVARRARSLAKERKLYLWDWSELSDPGARFENLVASHLLKACHGWNDLGLGSFELCYWRDRAKREVDFVLTDRRRPVLALECKAGETDLSPSLRFLSQLLPGVPCVQLVRRSGIDRRAGKTRVVSADRFLSALA